MPECSKPVLDINIECYILEKYIPAKEQQPTLQVVYCADDKLQSKSSDYLHGQQKCKQLVFPFARSALQKATIQHVTTLVKAEHEPREVKEVLELTLSVPNENDCQPGDTIAILPRNSDADINILLELLDLSDKADNCCSFHMLSTCQKGKAKLPVHIPTELTTPREILRDCLNLRAVPKKQFLHALAGCCNDSKEANFLSCLSSKEGAHFYNEIILEKAFSLIELLQICTSCKPTLELLVENLPRLLPRAYSIANSSLANSNEIKIIFSILTQKPGVTTLMLSSLANDAIKTTEIKPIVLMYWRNTNLFRYTLDEATTTQQILIAVGTGLAPFLGFLEHKKQLNAKLGVTEKLGETWLFIGARTKDSILYRQQLKEFLAEGVLDRFFESTSREADAKYHYIQDQLHANAKDFVTYFMQPTTILYVCADGAHISKSIKAAIKKCLIDVLTLTDTDVNDMFDSFVKNGKYREDIWS